MKVTTTNKRSTFMSLFLASLVVVAGMQSPVLHAQYDDFDDLDDTIGSDTLDMDDIDIDGKLSASELLKRRREKLEERNRLMMEKKVEDIRVKQEIALTNKLQNAFNNNLNALDKQDEVETKQAAPLVIEAPVPPAPVIETRIVEVPAPVIVERKTSRIIPMIGVNNVSGTRLDLESNVGFSILGETLLTNQLSVGLSVGYSTMDMTDISNQYVNTGYGQYYNNNYYNSYGQGRKINSKKLTIEAGGKFFFTEDSKLRPYLGAAVSYNRDQLQYESSNSYNFNNVNFGNEGYSSSALAGTARVGAEFDFNETVGFNLDLSFTKGFSSAMNGKSDATSQNPDQGRLENLAKEIQDSNVTAIQAGVVIKF